MSICTTTARRLALGLALALGLSGCATNPVTGRSQTLLVSESELLPLAADAWRETKQKTPISADQAAQARVRRIGLNIARGAGLADQPWEIVLFDTDERNAFVLPGGKIGVYRGLLELADNDDQLAAVLGHEVAHVTARHAAERASQGMLTQAGLAVGQAALGGSQGGQLAAAALGLGAQVGVLLPYSRLHETEADRIGIDYMVAAGYNPREAVRFWEKMQAASGSQRVPQLLSTHPNPGNRIENLQRYISERGY